LDYAEASDTLTGRAYQPATTNQRQELAGFFRQRGIGVGSDDQLDAARCYLIDTVTEIYRRAGQMASTHAAPIDIPDRARARLAGSNAITRAVSVANWTYKAAGQRPPQTRLPE
jgi:hypothetical protein